MARWTTERLNADNWTGKTLVLAVRTDRRAFRLANELFELQPVNGRSDVLAIRGREFGLVGTVDASETVAYAFDGAAELVRSAADVVHAAAKLVANLL